MPEEDLDVAEALSAIQDDFLDCRDIRHSWLRQGFWSEGGQLKRRLSCSRCTTTRTDTWSFDGRERVQSHYDYPDGYLLTGMHGHAKPTDVRHEAVARATVYADEQTMMEAIVRGRGRR